MLEITYQYINRHPPVALKIAAILLPERDVKNPNAFEQNIFALKMTKKCLLSENFKWENK